MSAKFNAAYTITALTPINLASGTATTDGIPFMAKNLSIQMKTGGTGRGYVMAGMRNGVVPVVTHASDLSAELAPATSTAPGGQWLQNDPIDLATVWIDGSHTGDVVTVSYDVAGS